MPFVCSINNTVYTCVVFSDDHGKTWSPGGLAQEGSKESEFVQTISCGDDGALYALERNFQKVPGKKLFGLSFNGGTNFSQVGTVDSLISPVTPQWIGIVSGLTRLSFAKVSGRNRILFSDPNCPNERKNMTIKVSYDETGSWSSGKVIYSGPSGYSDLVRISEEEAGLVYERGVHSAYEAVTFARMNVDWIDDGQYKTTPLETELRNCSPWIVYL